MPPCTTRVWSLLSKSYMNKLNLPAESGDEVSKTSTSFLLINAFICNKFTNIPLLRTAMLGATSTLEESIFRRSLGKSLFCCKKVARGNFFDTARTVPDPSITVHDIVDTSGDIGFNTLEDENNMEELEALLGEDDDDDDTDGEDEEEDVVDDASMREDPDRFRLP